MDKKHLNNLTETVKGILATKKRARDDDYILYGFYLNKNNLSVKTPFVDIYKMVKANKISSIESVGRTRRKLQELHPELRGDQHLETLRRQNEEVYEDYSRQTDL